MKLLNTILVGNNPFVNVNILNTVLTFLKRKKSVGSKLATNTLSYSLFCCVKYVICF
ncbi:hypothetical protein FM106_04840 [Brachybacterium faecium]|nr:hypothetical protein FM106_04840 [Brachybacterium faecium]